MNNGTPRMGTLAVWAGEEDPTSGAGTQVPIVRSVAFGYHDVSEWEAVGRGQATGDIYSRNTNPTVRAFEQKIQSLENAEAATSFASGMAAISNTLSTFLTPGDRIVSTRDTYGGTNKLFLEFLPRQGVEVELCPTEDTAVETALTKGCQVLYLETPTNPTLKVLDLTRLLKAGQKAGTLTIVDNTFATPINQQPLELGADLVVHSATKYLGGHADALGGAVCGTKDLVSRIYHYREITGAALDPTAAYLLLRGMKTLHLRIERQTESAMVIARHLSSNPAIAKVHYPGLEEDPGHLVAKRQMRGFGGIVSFELVGGTNAMRQFLPRLRYAHRAANLGSVETVAGPPSATSHVELTPEERLAAGIPEGLVRYSVGIEDPADLMADLDQALAP